MLLLLDPQGARWDRTNLLSQASSLRMPAIRNTLAQNPKWISMLPLLLGLCRKVKIGKVSFSKPKWQAFHALIRPNTLLRWFIAPIVTDSTTPSTPIALMADQRWLPIWHKIRDTKSTWGDEVRTKADPATPREWIKLIRFINRMRRSHIISINDYYFEIYSSFSG